MNARLNSFRIDIRIRNPHDNRKGQNTINHVSNCTVQNQSKQHNANDYPMHRYTMTRMISDSTIDLIRTFVRERDWDQYHAPGNLAKSVSIEAAELLECFQWNDQPREGDLEHIHEEIADVMIYCIMLANKLNLDLDDIIHDKMRKNSKKYPVEPRQ